MGGVPLTWSHQQLPFGIGDDGSRVDAILDAIGTDHKIDTRHRTRRITQRKCQSACESESSTVDQAIAEALFLPTGRGRC